MKFFLLTYVAYLAVYVAAEPSCPPESNNETVVYLPHPSDCSKFLSCHWGNLVELSCPNGTLWNDGIKACDLQANVNCTLEPATTTAPVEKCPEQYNPDHQVYLPHEDCTKYYICSWGGVAIEQKCPPNLHWNQQLSYCDYPGLAGCNSTSSPTSPPTTPSSTPSATNTTTPVPVPQSENCPEVYDPNHQVYFPHADCTKYYICTYEGNKLEQNCPAGLHWSQSNSYCDRPELAQCTPAKNDVDAPLLECPEVEQEDDMAVFFPHEDCTKYYVCSHRHPYEMDCPEGTYWNAQENVCDAPESSGCVPKDHD
ncbi:probable chitinase 10 [Aedes albopictus]|uniref:Chitin-binding type-2 domain-containing protein n=1 Tax=Aedes albopictus TaxID=7160 RepID=A0ABM1YTK5_AEDAL|nr:probable chitinase 10 [Aedes albopictus]